MPTRFSSLRTSGEQQPPRVVIIGGGFGGLEAAKALRKAPVLVTLVDRANHHTFQPLLYQVATAGLSPNDIAAPLRRILHRQKNAEVLLGEVDDIDAAAKTIRFFDGVSLSYDFLIVATGARHSYFGKDAWAQFAPGLKTVEEATEIRRRVLVAFEAAERVEDAEQRKAALTFVVVGGGPTGVELAGAISELARFTLEEDFRHIDPRRETRVILVEAGPRILPAFAPALSAKAEASLRKLGVEVRTSCRVDDINYAYVEANGERIPTYTVLWAAGVVASPLARILSSDLDHAGRVKVQPDLSVPGTPDVFVVGDMAAVLQGNGKPVPGVAPAAMQGGRHAARNVMRRLAGEPTLPFRYVDKGNLATIGRNSAVGEFGRFRLSGFLAWLMWLTIHIFFLIGFRNRIAVYLEWAYSYVSYMRSSRLITYPIEPTGMARVFKFRRSS